MKTSLFLLVFLFPFSLFANSNVFELKRNADCNMKERIIFISTDETKGIDHIIFSLCNSKSYSIKTYDADRISFEVNMEAKIISGDIERKIFHINLNSSITGEILYTVTKNNNSNYAIIRKASFDETDFSNLIADEYFLFTQSSSFLMLSKQKEFECKEISLSDILGLPIEEYKYDENSYLFSIGKLSSGIYFIIFTTDDKKIMKKIQVIR